MRNNLVLFILPNFSAGGAERVVLNLVGDLKSLGHSVNILVFNDEGSLSSMLPDNVSTQLKNRVVKKINFPTSQKNTTIKPKSNYFYFWLYKHSPISHSLVIATKNRNMG